MKVSSPTLAIIIGLSAWQAEAAGIDCAKPSSSADHMICQAPSLLTRDAIIQDLYSAALKRDAVNDIRDRQRRWVKSLQSCGDPACLQQHYDTQIGYLLTTKGGRSVSADFLTDGNDGNEGDLTIFGPVDGLAAISLASTYVGSGGSDAGDVNASSISGVVAMTKDHGRLIEDSCTIDFDRLNPKTWQVTQTGTCTFADSVTMQGTYRRH